MKTRKCRNCGKRRNVNYLQYCWTCRVFSLSPDTCDCGSPASKKIELVINKTKLAMWVCNDCFQIEIDEIQGATAIPERVYIQPKVRTWEYPVRAR